MKKFFVYVKRQEKLLKITLSIFILGFIVLMLYVHFDYEKNWVWYNDSEIIVLLKHAIIYWLIATVIIMGEIYYPILKAKWQKHREKVSRNSMNGVNSKNVFFTTRWLDSPMNSILVACCYIWIIENIGRILYNCVLLSNGVYEGIDMYYIGVGIAMCVIIVGIIKGKGAAYVCFIILEIINGCVLSNVERGSTGIIISCILCAIMSLLLLLKNKKGQTGYNVMFNEENLCRERTDNSKTINVLREDRTCDLIYSEGKEKCVNESSCVDENDTPNSYCRVCGKLIEDDSIYCVHCGNKLN